MPSSERKGKRAAQRLRRKCATIARSRQPAAAPLSTAASMPAGSPRGISRSRQTIAATDRARSRRGRRRAPSRARGRRRLSAAHPAAGPNGCMAPADRRRRGLRYHDGRRGAALRRALRVDVEFAFPAVGVDVGDILSRAHFLEKRDGGPQIAGRLRSRRKRKREHDDDTERKAFSMSTSNGWRRFQGADYSSCHDGVRSQWLHSQATQKGSTTFFTKESVMAWAASVRRFRARGPG